MTESRGGVWFGVGAYGLWGLFPLFWPLLVPAGAVEVLSHRIIWSLLFSSVLLLMLRRREALRAVVRNRRKVLLLGLAGSILAVNWGTYIYGVNAERVVETSLGYFVNPLVTVLLGVLVLRERLRPAQWAALALGGVAVIVLSVEAGRPPWLALVLAGTFGTYGLLKKTTGVGPAEGLAIESAVLTPLALGYLLLLGSNGTGTFTSEGAGHASLLVVAGLVTAVPLVLFGAAAARVPLSTLGMLQYLAPTLQLLIGVVVRHEPMPPGRLAGFAIVWLALAVFTVDLARHARRRWRADLAVAEPA